MGEAWAVKLRYTPRALAELDEVLTYIAERSPQGARNVETRIHDIITMILQQDIAIVKIPKPRFLFKFALGNVFFKRLRSTYNFKNFNTIQIMCYLFAIHLDSCAVPLTNSVHPFHRLRRVKNPGISLYQIIK